MDASAGVRVPNPSLPSQLMILGVEEEWRRVKRGFVEVTGKEEGLERERWEEMERRGRGREAGVVVAVVVLRRNISSDVVTCFFKSLSFSIHDFHKGKTTTTTISISTLFIYFTILFYLIKSNKNYSNVERISHFSLIQIHKLCYHILII